jgi:6,7-dimethyl-8-ribityllumazine synthase
MATHRVSAAGAAFDALLRWAAFICGETTYYETVANESARGLMELTVWRLAIGMIDGRKRRSGPPHPR